MDGASATIRRSARAAAYVAVFLAFIDNFALLPLIAPRATELGADAFGVGLAVAAYSLTNLVLNLLGGTLTDRIGRRRVLIVSLVASPVCLFLYGLATTYPMFLAVRVIHGAFGGALVVSLFALLADLAPEGSRGARIGRAGALIGLAAIVGPAVAGLAARELGTSTVLIGLSGALAIGVLAIVRFLPETLPPAEQAVAADSDEAGTLRRLLAEPRLRVALLAIFGLEAAVGIVTGFLKDGIVERQIAAGMTPERALQWATGAQGGLFSIFAVIAVVLMLSPVARLVDRRGALGLSVVGLLALAASTALLAWSTALTADIGGIVLYGLGFGLVFPAATAIVGIATAPAERGRAYGLFNVAFDAGLAAGPLLAGALATAAGVGPFGLATVMLLAIVVLLPIAGRTARDPRTDLDPDRSAGTATASEPRRA